MNYHFELDPKSTPTYRKYWVVSKQYECTGFVVFELYGFVWNLELICASPQHQGIGTKLLQYALHQEKLDPKHMTVCPSHADPDYIRFFERNGFIIEK